MGRPPKQIGFDPIKEAALNSNLPTVPGYVFRWVNPSLRYKKGWGIFKPVLRDSEIGKQAIEQLGPMNDKFAGMNTEANFIYRGGDSILAYATVEANAEMKRRDAEAAEKRISMIDAAGLRRNVIVPAATGYAAAFKDGDEE